MIGCPESDEEVARLLGLNSRQSVIVLHSLPCADPCCICISSGFFTNEPPGCGRRCSCRLALSPRTRPTVPEKQDIAIGNMRRLRHTFASLLLQEAAPITYVSRQLGHKDSAITLRVYAHWLPDTSSARPSIA